MLQLVACIASQSHMAGALRKKAIRIGRTDLIAMWG
jgi:hypothetical protein